MVASRRSISRCCCTPRLRGDEPDACFRELLGGGRHGRFHPQHVVEAIEVVEQPDGRQELDDFAFGVEAFELLEVFVAVVLGVGGHDFGGVQGDLLGLGEEGRVAPVAAEGIDLLLGGAEAQADGGVAGEAVAGTVHLRCAYDEQLFEPRGQGALVEHGVHVRERGAKDLGPVREGSEEVRHVAAVAEKLVVEITRLRCNLRTRQPAETGHD
jgi:hypothetical protein